MVCFTYYKKVRYKSCRVSFQLFYDLILFIQSVSKKAHRCLLFLIGQPVYHFIYRFQLKSIQLKNAESIIPTAYRMSYVKNILISFGPAFETICTNKIYINNDVKSSTII